MKPGRSAPGLNTQLRQTCLKKLLQRSQLLTNRLPRGDSLIIVLHKLSDTFASAVAGRVCVLEGAPACGELRFVIVPPVCGARSNDRARALTVAPFEPGWGSIILLCGSLARRPVQDKHPPAATC